MPCDQIRTTTLKLEGFNISAIEKALKELGYETQKQNSLLYFRDNRAWNPMWCTFDGKQLQMKHNNAEYDWKEQVQEIKMRASRVNAISHAKKFGWEVKTSLKEPYKLQITRRRM